MRIPRIYISNDLAQTSKVSVDSKTHKYIKDVLRLTFGDPIILFNGDGHDYNGEICELHKKAVSIQLHEKQAITNESPLSIHLLQPLCRSEKMDWCLQKATELGVSKITPFISSRVNIHIPANRLGKKMDHWRSVIQSACEQSGRATLPAIEAPCNFTGLLPRLPADSIKIITSPTANQSPLTDQAMYAHFCICAIGPEGGFAGEEIEFAQNAGFTTQLLGPRVLRLETAVLATIALVQSRWGDLH